MYLKLFFISVFSLTITSIYAQVTINVSPKNDYVEKHLDLLTVSRLYGNSPDLTDFERRLNCDENPVTSIDLNEDGIVDYLRVSEKIQDNIKIIIVQSELSKNVYEDVATINVPLEKRDTNHRSDSGIGAADIIAPFLIAFLDILLFKK